MRVAIIYRPKSPAPPELLPQFLEGVSAWVDKYGGRMSTLEFFAGGGGFGVIDVDDSAEVQRIMAENPFTAYSEVEVRPVVDPGTAIGTLREVFAGMAGG
jgi:hypothetical protein